MSDFSVLLGNENFRIGVRLAETLTSNSLSSRLNVMSSASKALRSNDRVSEDVEEIPIGSVLLVFLLQTFLKFCKLV